MASNKDVVNQIIEGISTGKLDLFDQAFAKNYKIHEPVDGDLDLAGFKKMLGKYRSAFPDLKMTGDEITEAGDRVLVRWTCRGTHKGELQGIAPTNKSVVIHGISAMHFENGKVVEEWVEWDALGLMRQLGAMEEARPSP